MTPPTPPLAAGPALEAPPDNEPMIHYLTGEPLTHRDQVRQGEYYRVRCDDGIERIGMIAFTQGEEWLFLPAEMCRRPTTDFAPARRPRGRPRKNGGHDAE